MKTFGKICLALLIDALQLFVLGVVLMFLWNWFIVPLGAVSIGYWLALGIALTINTFLIMVKRDNGHKDEEFLESIGRNLGYIVGLLLIWGMGAIIHLFI